MTSTTEPSLLERVYLVDLDIVVGDGEDVGAVCDELATGLLLQHTVLIEAGPAGGWPVVRFTGPRGQLQQLCNRYHGDGTDAGSMAVQFETQAAARAAQLNEARGVH